MTPRLLYFFFLTFFLSPLIFLFLFLPDRYRRTGSFSLGLSRPAHGGPETAPQPFRTCAERRLSEVVLFQLLFFPGVHSGISLLFSPRPGRVSGCGGWDKLISPRLPEPRVSRNGSGNTQCLGGTNRGPVPSLSESLFDY